MKRFSFFLYLPIIVALLIIPTNIQATENTEPETSAGIEQTQNTATQNELDEIQKEPSDAPGEIQKRTGIPSEAQKRIDMIRNNINERRALQKGVRVQEKVKLQLEASLDTTINQFESATQRLTDFSERLEIRLIRMEERGHDVSAAFEALELAQAEIEASAEAIAKTAVSAIEAISSDTPRARQLVVRTSLADARSSLRNARESLFQVITTARSSVDTSEKKDASTGLGDQ